MFTSPKGADDIFSVSDQGLADAFKFIEEIGFGNWGSVWLCEPRTGTSHIHPYDDDFIEDPRSKRIAVKIVHRNKTPTTSARVRSLWNEMKIVRSFKHDPHPSIVPFYNFIITPSYALITMQYLPRLIPVEVAEPKAREWCHSLVSGIDFLHKRGIVHNDIKPANILLSSATPPVPVLVDFGFAEKYDTGSKKAFISNLAYGTPEYLSPERARGLTHDTRKSDVWALGITFFEILVGRTPFEKHEGESFATKEDLEQYWTRTLKGKWLGEWNISRQFEKLLKKMMSPNADMRCTAREALNDPYFADVTFDGEDVSFINSEEIGTTSQAMDMSLPWSSPSTSLPKKWSSKRSLFVLRDSQTGTSPKSALKSKFSSLGKVKKGGNAPVFDDNNNTNMHRSILPTVPSFRLTNENTILKSDKITASRKPVPFYTENDTSSNMDSMRSTRVTGRRPLGDVTNRADKHDAINQRGTVSQKPHIRNELKGIGADMTGPSLSAVFETSLFNSENHVNGTSTQDHSSSTFSVRKSWKRSFGTAKNLHTRSASMADTVPAASSLGNDFYGPAHTGKRGSKGRKSWQNFSPVINASKSSLPAVQQAVRNIQMATENRLDRMTLWIRSVEETVEDARRDLESGSSTKLPKLPPCPVNLPRKKVPRRILTADKIFKGKVDNCHPPSALRDHHDSTLLLAQGRLSAFSNQVQVVNGELHTLPSASESINPRDSSTAMSIDVVPENVEACSIQRSPPTADASMATNAMQPGPSITVETGQDSSYERLLLDSSYVKRVGLGYQSNINGPVDGDTFKSIDIRKSRFFNTVRKPAHQMDPEIDRRTTSVDELGTINNTDRGFTMLPKEERPQTLNLVQRAVRAVLSAATISRRSSRAF